MTSADMSKVDELSSFSRTKRGQIIEGALKAFFKYGYEGTSMNRVAEESGVIKQTIYSHFTDKEGLFKAIIEDVTLRHVREEFALSIPFETSADVVLRRVAKVFEARCEDANYIALMRTVIGESARFPELAQLYINTVIKPGLSLLTAFFKARPELHINDPEATARIFCGSLVNYVLVQKILNGENALPLPFSRVVDSLIAMILNQDDFKRDD